MSLSQRVVDKAVTTGGWIPVPQEMFNATGISEENILATKQWGKVVPMMRKIGDYVLSTYLANDPRRAMIMKWKSRYCEGPNKKKKENMISPIVGFIYIIDSFKNHRGPSEDGKARNEWRKRLTSQINCKAVWKRTHTALAKIIHNRMNMADDNPGKIEMRMMRELYRRPDVPWSMADYGNLGYPYEDDEDVDYDQPLPSAVEVMNAPFSDDWVIASQSSGGPPKPPIDPSGEAIVNVIEKKKKEKVNKSDGTNGGPPKPPPPPTGTVAIKEAITAHDAEGDFPAGDDDDDDDDQPFMFDDSNAIPLAHPDAFGEYVEASDGDEGGPSPPPTGPAIMADGGYPDDGEPPASPEANPVEQPVQPPPPPPPSAPSSAAVQVDQVGETTGNNLMDADITVGDSPSIPPSPPPSTATATVEPFPGLSGVDLFGPDDQDKQLLLSNAVPRPPKPPAPGMSPAVIDLENQIKTLQADIAAQANDTGVLQAEKDRLEAEIARLNGLLEQQKVESTKQKAELTQYEQEKAAWEKMKAQLDTQRKRMEMEFEKLKADFQAKEAQYLDQLDELNKRVGELTEASKQAEANLTQAQRTREQYADELEKLRVANSELAQQIQAIGDQPQQEPIEDRTAEIADLRSRGEELEKQLLAATEKLNKAETEVTQLTAARATALKELEAAASNRENFASAQQALKAEYDLAVRQKTEELTREYEQEKARLEEERAKLQEQADRSGNKITELEAKIHDSDSEIATLTRDIELAEARGRQAEKEAHASEVDARIKALEDKVREKNDKIRLLRGDIATLRGKISELENQVATLNAQINGLNLALQKAESQLKTLTSTESVTKLRADLAKAGQQAALANQAATQSLQREKKRAEELQQRLNAANGEYTQKLGELEASWRGKNDDIQHQLDELRETADQLQAERDEARDLNASITKQKNELLTQISSNAEEISRLRQQIATSDADSARMAQLIAANEQLNQKLSNLQQKLQAGSPELIEGALDEVLQAQKNSSAREAELREQLANVKDRVSTLEKSVELKEEEYKKLFAAYQSAANVIGLQPNETLTSRLYAMKELLDRAKQELENTRAERDQAYENGAKVRTGLSAVQSENADLKVANEQMRAKIAELEKTSQSLTEKLAGIAASERDAKARLEQFERQIIDLNKAKTEMEQRSAANDRDHANEVARLNAAHADEVAQLNATIAQQDELIAELTQQILDAEEDIAELDAEIEQLRTELVEKDEINEDLSQQIKAITDERERLRTQLKNLRILYKDLESELYPMEKHARLIDRDGETIEDDVTAGPAHRRRKIPTAAVQAMAEEEEVPEETEEGVVEAPASAVSSGPPAATIDPETGVVRIMDHETNEAVTIQRFIVVGADGRRRRRVALWVKWDMKGNPIDGFFVNKKGRKIPENSWRQIGIPFDNFAQLQQHSIMNAIRQGLTKPDFAQFFEQRANPARTKAFDNDLMMKLQDTLPQVENTPVPESVTNLDTASTDADDPNNNLVLVDHAGLFPIFQRFAESKKASSYAGVVKQLLHQLKRWFDSNVNDKLSFLTDPNYVPANRLALIRQDAQALGSSVDAMVERIWTSLLSNVVKLTANQIPNGFKAWLRVWYNRFKDGFVIDLDPVIIYHTLASMVHDTGHFGSRAAESGQLVGFGATHLNGSNSGFVPIPTAPSVPITGLYDYYGYGFDPFLKTLHNPPSYFTTDYHGYH